MTSTGRFRFTIEADQLHASGVCTRENADYLALTYTHYIALLADSPLCSTDMKPRRVFSTFLRYLLSTPFAVVAKRYADLSHELLSNLTNFGSGSTTGPFIDGFRDTPVFKEYHEFYLTGRPDLLRYLVTFLNFTKKAVIDDVSLEATAFRSWLETEERISNVRAPSRITSDLRHLINLLLPPVGDMPFMGRFSNGSTMDGMRSLSTKLDHFDYNVYIDRAFFRAQHGVRRIGLTLEALPCPTGWVQARDEVRSCRRESELMFVPKTYGTYRSICKERPTPAFFQQALMFELVEIISNGPLRHVIDLRDQTLNQRMAIRGSITGALDTLDLSSASDSVTLELVRAVFPPHILRFMLATRSTTVVFRHGDRTERFQVAKFAPMGSAVCFPTQCILFAAVVLREYLIREIGAGFADLIRSTQDLEKYILSLKEDDSLRLQRFRIYGDDIICDTHVTQGVITTLNEIGFLVNESKSFVSSQAVRESCGIYAYMGHDITPLLWKVPHYSGELPMQVVIALTTLCNRVGDLGMRNMHRFLVHTLLEYPIKGYPRRSPGRKNAILFTDNRDRFGIFSLSPRNEHLDFRSWDPLGDQNETCQMYQRDEYLCLMPRVRKFGRDYRDQRQRAEYHRWVVGSYMRERSEGGSPSTYERKVDVVAPQLGWTPA